jgi:hypothetical protein
MMVNQFGYETHIIHILSVRTISVQLSSIIPVSLHAVRVNNHKPFLIGQCVPSSAGQIPFHVLPGASPSVKDKDQRELATLVMRRGDMKAISSRSPFIGHGSGAVPMVIGCAFAPVDGTAT